MISHVIIILTYVFITLMLVLRSFIYIILLLTNLFCLLNLQKIAKKKVIQIQLVVSLRIFGMNRTILVFMFCIHACVEFHILSICDTY